MPALGWPANEHLAPRSSTVVDDARRRPARRLSVWSNARRTSSSLCRALFSLLSDIDHGAIDPQISNAWPASFSLPYVPDLEDAEVALRIPLSSLGLIVGTALDSVLVAYLSNVQPPCQRCARAYSPVGRVA
jgi:hypothetical protein